MTQIGGIDQHRTTVRRVLVFTVLGVVTLFLSSRLLEPWLHAYAWPYLMAATTIALFVSLNVDTTVARHFALAILASSFIFGIAGAFSVVLFLLVWEPRQEAPAMALLPAYFLVATNLLIWPPGARLLLRTSWGVAISLGIVVFLALPILMLVGLLIALIAALVLGPS